MAGEPATNGALRRICFPNGSGSMPTSPARWRPRTRRYDRVAPEVRDAIATAFVRTGGAAEFEIVLRRFRSAGAEAEMFRPLGALTAATDPALVERVLVMIEHKEILLSLAPAAVVGASRNLQARAVAWAWLQRNLDLFAESFRGTGRMSDLL